jgi:hypothetical protein
MVTGQRLSSHILGNIITIHQFTQHFRSIPEHNRVLVYSGFISGRPAGVPSIRTINRHVPKCAAAILDDLLARLSHYDYAQRCVDLVGVHRLLEIAMIRLRHEAKARRIICDNKAIRQKDVYV